jgi:hypothetical protein
MNSTDKTADSMKRLERRQEKAGRQSKRLEHPLKEWSIAGKRPRRRLQGAERQSQRAHARSKGPGRDQKAWKTIRKTGIRPATHPEPA